MQARAKDPHIDVMADQHSFSSSIKRSVQAEVRNADIQTVLRDQPQRQRVQDRLIKHDLKITIRIDASVRLELTKFRLEPSRADDVQSRDAIVLEFQTVQTDDLPVKRAAGGGALKIQVEVKIARLVHLRPGHLRTREARRTRLHDQNRLE
jgi:hypothetical protein